MKKVICRLLPAVFALSIGSSSAAPPEREGLFRDLIQPTLKQKCLGCHGEGNTFGKLDLRSREAMLQGGQRGPAVVAGDADASLLIRALSAGGELSMPPGENAQLPAETIAAFRDWVNSGAAWAAPEPKAGLDWGNFKEQDIWAFRPLAAVEPPYEQADPAQVRTPIDAFLLRELGREGISPAPRADRRTLIRRATFDLTGLPPTPAEVDAFVSDPADQNAAFKTVVERLLASPRYGERWARHWLDVARYADTAGYSNDFERPNAWRYRDYVIRAFNSDKPYDRFILEQVAGDELFPNQPEAIIATGFLRMGPWEHTGMSVAAVTRQMWLDDVTHNTAASFLGLTLGCARCHDHKFDPIATKDYYRVQAVYATTAFARRPLEFLETERRDGFDEGKQRMDQTMAQTEAAIEQYLELGRKRLEEWKAEGRNLGSAESGSKSGLQPDEFEGLKLYRKHQAMYKESIERYDPLAFTVTSGLVEDWNDVGPAGKNSYFEVADYQSPETHILVGGSLEAPAEKVSPGVLSAVEQYSGLGSPEIPDSIEGRRSALARWIASPENPLTARVMVNRIWQYHFGRGIVDDANNFGKMGKPPSHPEMLDWLARFFVERGWSVKAVHRVILLSEAYQRAGEHPEFELVKQKDPDNKLYSYFSPHRVEAEVLRDSMLAVAGELSPAIGGPGTYPQINRDAAEQPRHAMGTLRPVYHASPTKLARNRRSIYGYQQRSLVDPMVDVFNAPSMDMSCERRDSTTVPTQAFTLFNGDLTRDLALAFADRLVREEADAGARLELAFRLSFGRAPEAREIALVGERLAALSAYHDENPPPAKTERKPLRRSITSELTGEEYPFEEPQPPWQSEPNLHPSDVSAEIRAWAGVALALFNSNEFAYLY